MTDFIFRIMVLVSYTLSPLWLQGQSLPDRYRTPIFTQWSETTNLTFSTGVPRPNPGGGFYEWLTGYPLNVREYQTTAVDLKMNVFVPVGDTLSKRPVIIIAFGGGFLSGSKDHWSIRLLAQELAKRGFVTAVMDYRLGMNIFNAPLSMRAVYRGVQDGRSAVRFFKADAAGANVFRADPNHIYLGGHSSGGFIALHNAYMDRDSLRPASTRVWFQNGYQVPDQLPLDSVGNNRSFNGRARAIFNLAGAIGYTEYIEESNEPILTSFHSTDDETVPYYSGEPFSNLLWLVVGSDLPDVYGSHPISVQANAVGLLNELNTYTNRGHSVHENGSNALHTDIVPKISNWFFYNLLQPDPVEIEGNDKVCNDHLVQTYSVRKDSAAYYDWQVSGGSFVMSSPFSEKVTVEWQENAPFHQLRVTPYSYHRARGETDTLDVSVRTRNNNIWQAVTTQWSDASNWSLGIVPDICHNAIFPDWNDDSSTAILDSSALVSISKLSVGTNHTLFVHSPLTVRQGGGISVRGTLFVSDSISVTKIADNPEISLLVDGLLSVQGNGALQTNNPVTRSIQVGQDGILRNNGNMYIDAKLPINFQQDVYLEGSLENQGYFLYRNPGQHRVVTVGSGIFNNTGILEVREE